MSITPYLPSALLLTLCAVLPAAYLTTGTQVGCSAYLRALLLFHFTHANIFHLLANTIALAILRPRWGTTLLAIPTATIAAALLPTLIIIPSPALPTCGLSAIICAAIARTYIAWHRNILPFIFIQLIIIPFFPNFNFKIHILSFLIAYITWSIIYKLRKTGQ